MKQIQCSQKSAFKRPSCIMYRSLNGVLKMHIESGYFLALLRLIGFLNQVHNWIDNSHNRQGLPWRQEIILRAHISTFILTSEVARQITNMEPCNRQASNTRRTRKNKETQKSLTALLSVVYSCCCCCCCIIYRKRPVLAIAALQLNEHRNMSTQKEINTHPMHFNKNIPNSISVNVHL